jgi:Kef-type K+ transport system membrane component KefB
MQENIIQLLLILFISTLLGWITKTSLYTSFVGYVAGGIVIGTLFTVLGLGAPDTSQLEVLKSIGVTIFFFEAGISIGLANLLKSLDKILIIELVAYPLLWLAAKIIGGFIGLDIVAEAALFLMFIDSSSMLSMQLASSLRNLELRSLAVLETNFEDLAQFVLFSTLFAAETTLPTLIGVGVSVMKIITILVIMGFALSIVLRRFRGFIQKLDTSSRYLLLLSIALLYSAIAQQMGLPFFIGSFVAGIIVSQFMGSSSEEFTLLSGVRELGLLLYFSSLGTEIVLIFMEVGSLSIIITGVAIGVAAVIARAFSLLIGLVMSGAKPGHLVPYAVALSSVGETSIILVDALATRGGLTNIFKMLILTSIVTSIAISSLLYRRSYKAPLAIASILPQRVTNALSRFSNTLLHTSSIIVYTGRASIRFLTTLLVAVYLVHVATLFTKYLPHPLALIMLAVVTIPSYAIIVIEFARFLRKTFEKALSSADSVKDLWEAALRLSTAIVTILAITVLLATFHTIVTEANIPKPLSYAFTTGINITTIALLAAIAITTIKKGIKKIRKRQQNHD